jgi:hypothetical protein
VRTKVGAVPAGGTWQTSQGTERTPRSVRTKEGVLSGQIRDTTANSDGKDAQIRANNQSRGSPGRRHMADFAGDGTSRIASAILNQAPLSREIQNLNMLVREQSKQVKLLEQQLHDERAKTELQLQRLHYSHRLEINRLHGEIERLSMVAVEEMSPFHHKGEGGVGGVGADMSRFEQTLDAKLAAVAAESAPHIYTTHPSLNPSFPIRLNTSEFGPRAAGAAGGPGWVGSAGKWQGKELLPFTPTGKPTNNEHSANTEVGSSSSSSSKRGLLSFLEHKHAITAALTESSLFDLTPRKLDGVPSSGAGTIDSWDPVASDTDDRDFLASIEKLQSEIKKINNNISIASPPWY